jgi:PIN domain nuclease of toxin-antitoxin system
MTRYLLDTHVFVWSIIKPEKLTRPLHDELKDYNNRLYLSPISLMEIALKNRDGNLPLGEDFRTFADNLSNRLGIEILDIKHRHLITLNRLSYPNNHKDPFDHLIISQAIAEQMCLISADSRMKYYTGQGLTLLEN